MKLYILGIAGTFMAGIAAIARSQGHEVGGCDAQIYPPMSTQLDDLGIAYDTGYLAEHLARAKPDLVIVGNAMKRGNPMVEYMLDEQLPYRSGPQWLADEVLQHKTVIAVAGTHGKTTTSSMIMWMLETAGLNPGYLIGGIPGNLPNSARLTDSPYFVIEADEYDTAFFDKRAKCIHYRPTVLVLNNLEFDHADIYSALDQIQTQFQQVIRTVPGKGSIIYPQTDLNIAAVIERGCWSKTVLLDSPEEGFSTQSQQADNSEFDILLKGEPLTHIKWDLYGEHNKANAMAAVAVGFILSISGDHMAKALGSFKASARRMEFKGESAGIRVYDDFAHHPTAIQLTLEGFRAHVGSSVRILCVIELRSYTMRSGHHRATLVPSLQEADAIFVKLPTDFEWDGDLLEKTSDKPLSVYEDTEDLMIDVVGLAKPGDCIVIMSNGGFDNIHQRLLAALG